MLSAHAPLLTTHCSSLTAHCSPLAVHHAGKTTVVAPLLALLLGNHQTLVMQVVPPALLEFSRSVMRQRFSSILQKPVYTFNFDRFTAASPELLSKILQAPFLLYLNMAVPTGTTLTHSPRPGLLS